MSRRPFRKRSISDTTLDRLAPHSTQNKSANIQDVLDCRSKCEYRFGNDTDEDSDDVKDNGQRRASDGAIDTTQLPIEEEKNHSSKMVSSQETF